MCLYPKLIKNKKYISNKKNGGIIPAVLDKRVLVVPVGCGKCMECRKQKSRSWQVRLQEEIKNDKTGNFVTLTISSEKYKELDEEIKNLTGYNRENAIAKLAIRRFLENWRSKFKKSVKHWLITELGGNGTENVHIHGIIWTKEKEEIKKKWIYGYSDTGQYINEKSVNYMVKYMTKIDKKHKEYIPVICTSAGIGKNYIEKNKEKHKYKKNETREDYKTRTGLKLNLPIYYRNKIYTEEEKEKLWLEKLDKNTRYINGIEIDISENENKYYKVLEIERKKNKKLGYGDDEVNWERRRYENERRR